MESFEQGKEGQMLLFDEAGANYEAVRFFERNIQGAESF